MADDADAEDARQGLSLGRGDGGDRRVRRPGETGDGSTSRRQSCTGGSRRTSRAGCGDGRVGRVLRHGHRLGTSLAGRLRAGDYESGLVRVTSNGWSISVRTRSMKRTVWAGRHAHRTRLRRSNASGCRIDAGRLSTGAPGSGGNRAPAGSGRDVTQRRRDAFPPPVQAWKRAKMNSSIGCSPLMPRRRGQIWLRGRRAGQSIDARKGLAASGRAAKSHIALVQFRIACFADCDLRVHVARDDPATSA